MHHALCNVIEPLFERGFIFDSYANRVGKGTHAALDRAQEFARRYPYVLQCDVRQFFPSLDLAILRETLARKIADPDVLWLIDRILASGVGVFAEEYESRGFPAMTCWPPRGRAACRSATSPASSGPTAISIRSTTSSSASCAAPATCATSTTSCFSPMTSRRSGAWREAVVDQFGRLRLTIHPGAHPRR